MAAKITPDDAMWATLRAEYAQGDESYAELAKRFNVSVHTINSRAAPKRENWPQRRLDFQRRQLEETNRIALQARLKHEKENGEVRLRYADYARRVALATMERADEMIAAGRLTADQACRVTSALRRCQEIEFTALGIADRIVDVNDVTDWGAWILKHRASRGLDETIPSSVAH